MSKVKKQGRLSCLYRLKNRLCITGILKASAKLLPQPNLEGGATTYKARVHNMAILVKPNSEWRIIAAGEVYRGAGLSNLYDKLEELKHA